MADKDTNTPAAPASPETGVVVEHGPGLADWTITQHLERAQEHIDAADRGEAPEFLGGAAAASSGRPTSPSAPVNARARGGF